MTTRWLRSIDPNMRIELIGFRSHGTRPVAAHLGEPSPEAMTRLGGRLRSTGFAEVTVI